MPTVTQKTPSSHLKQTKKDNKKNFYFAISKQHFQQYTLLAVIQLSDVLLLIYLLVSRC